MLHRRYVIERLIKKHGYKSGVELGVWKGDTFKHICRQCPDIAYVGIDLYAPQEGTEETYTEGENGHKWDHAAYAKDIVNFLGDLEQHSHRLLIEDTVAASWRFVDGSIDFVFVDADHSYEGVKRDIEAYLPKIKNGGMMIFHDWGDPRFPGVQQAILEFFDIGMVTEYDDHIATVRIRR